jgi:hypothetical protein
MKSLNKFYVVKNKSDLSFNERFDLKELDQRVIYLSTGGKNGTKHFYRDCTIKDYDGSFRNLLLRTEPVYEIDKVLNYHFDAYRKKENQAEDFIKHIKYVILFFFEKDKIRKSLLEEWIQIIENTVYKKALIPSQEIEMADYLLKRLIEKGGKCNIDNLGITSEKISTYSSVRELLFEEELIDWFGDQEYWIKITLKGRKVASIGFEVYLLQKQETILTSNHSPKSSPFVNTGVYINANGDINGDVSIIKSFNKTSEVSKEDFIRAVINDLKELNVQEADLVKVEEILQQPETAKEKKFKIMDWFGGMLRNSVEDAVKKAVGEINFPLLCAKITEIAQEFDKYWPK